MSQQRIQWIDNAKGLIIFFVLLLHAKIPWHSVNFVGSWFMPCFFLISGLLFRMKNDSIKDTIFHRVRTLLVPYISLSVLFVFLNPNTYQGNILANFKTNAWDIMMGFSGFMTMSLWFVYTLFEVCCATTILHKIIQHFKIIHKNYIIGFIMLCCIICDRLYFQSTILPFNLADFFISWFMYLFGYLLQPHQKCLEKIPIRKLLYFAIITLVLSIVLYEVKYPTNTIVSEAKRIASLLTATFSLITLTFALTHLIPDNFIGASLRYLANNAMCFLAVHMWVICMCELYMPLYNPYLVAILALTLSLVLMPFANKFTPWLVGKSRS